MVSSIIFWATPFAPVLLHSPEMAKQDKETNARLMHWYHTLQLYVFTVQHQAEKDNTNADFLSHLGYSELASPWDQELDLREWGVVR